MFISATPFSGPEGKGFGFVFFRISDRYALEITIRIPALTDPIHESDRYSYEDDGELLIRDDEAVPKSMRGELAMIKEPRQTTSLRQFSGAVPTLVSCRMNRASSLL